MKTFNRQSACVLAAVAALLSACGGGTSDTATDTHASSNAGSGAGIGIGGNVKTTNTGTTESPVLSANQAAFEEFLLNPGGGSFRIDWSTALVAGQLSLRTLYGDSATLTASPLTSGPQNTTQTDPVNLAKTLPAPTMAPTRVLKDGVILVVPGKGLTNRTTYVGSDVRVDTLATDGFTVAYSFLRTHFQTVELSGPISSAPVDFKRFHDVLFINSSAVDPAATFLPGSKFMTFTRTNQGDRYNAFDCNAATTGANVSPCATNTTLTAALTKGLVSNSDRATYKMGDGTLRTVSGVQIWVANAPRPKSAVLSNHDEYRIYFQMAGNVYTGSLIQDGAVVGNSFYVTNPSATTLPDMVTPLTYDLRLNKAAYDSITSALKI